ncbi:MAG: metal ABC transporter permease [Verrucomicrobia bacterium]|nr:metal ABC transporter permease [Verrucomicrobiota bacterium]
MLRLQDYNTRVVVLGTTLLGLAAGVVGSFTLLRKRALMGDALSHAMLPGIGLAFMISVAAGGTGKSLPVLLTGATLSGLLGLGTVLAVRHFTRLKEDTALGIVLSVYFGAGVAVLGVVQRMGEGHSAGLESFIYGKAASLVAADTAVIAVASALVIGVSALLFKEFRLLCFDAGYAATQGWPVVRLDLVMMSLVVVVTVIGLQAVGLVLIIALLIIPAAAARFWTERLRTLTWIAAGMGAASCAIGAAASALLPNLPSGAMIVLVSTGLFLLSLLGVANAARFSAGNAGARSIARSAGNMCCAPCTSGVKRRRPAGPERRRSRCPRCPSRRSWLAVRGRPASSAGNLTAPRRTGCSSGVPIKPWR